MSEYDNIVVGSLRLRKGQGIKKKKKKHHKHTTVVDIPHDDVRTDELAEHESPEKAEKTKMKSHDQSHLTKAQREWEKRREKRIVENALSKAVKSHKQRIIELNNHLETLTEHFDIQKVSWTK
ncbi:unnamed protein product [Echinostoma caproni]|uniref:Protein FAM32A n=1 Tax=Echinostoma caproni TaxID=27848 RepID=A0A183AR00_9TREM|nr:unnamed protein product [Echinostoma caproni]